MPKTAEIIEIATPRKYLLNGLRFGPARARRAVIFVHGLGSVVFAHHEFLLPLMDKRTAVLFFGNRGSGTIGKVRRAGKSGKMAWGGMALEKFTDAADDIEGAVRFAEKRSAREICLVGHSTGCQKIAYYLAKYPRRRHVKSAVLMAPISDYAGIKTQVKPAVLRKALQAAENLIRRKRPFALLPESVWPDYISAQRFASLYKGEGPEEIFPYWTRRNPAALRRIKKPLLIILAEKDQHSDRPATAIAQWFTRHLKTGDALSIIPGADHSFHKKEDALRRDIRRWLAGLK